MAADNCLIAFIPIFCRLRQAHKCSQISSRPAYARPTDAEAGGGDVAVQDDEAAKRIHGQFMQMAMQLIDGRMDSSQYEDSCRQLLGIDRSFCKSVCMWKANLQQTYTYSLQLL